MSGRGSKRGSARRAAIVALSSAAILQLTLGCSGPTDIVGVVDDAESAAGDEPAPNATGVAPATEPGAAEADDAASDAGDVALLLVGRPVPGWLGEAIEWPLSMPLAELFAGEPPGDRDSRDRLMPSPWPSGLGSSRLGPSRRLASSFVRGSARSRSDVDARSAGIDARLLILDEQDARRLLALMASDGSADTERAAVFRDALGDVYRVSLESDEMLLDGVGCGGRMRREAFECEARDPSDP